MDNQITPLNLPSLESVASFAEIVAKSGLAPKSFDTKEKVILAIVAGKELGISPMQSLQGLQVINGKIGVSGDLAKALCEGAPNCESITDEIIGEPGTDNRGVSVTVNRTHRPPLTRSFTVREAKVAGLWGKLGRDGQPTPWVTYPQRMIYYRALGFALRDAFSNVLKGLKTTEELMDYQEAKPAYAITIDELKKQEFVVENKQETSGRSSSSETTTDSIHPEPQTRRRGRPPGSPNKPKEEKKEQVNEETQATADTGESEGEPVGQNIQADNPEPVAPVSTGLASENTRPDPKAEIIAAIRAQLGDIPESRLLVQMREWKFGPADASALDQFSQNDLEMIYKRWDQLIRFIKK